MMWILYSGSIMARAFIIIPFIRSLRYGSMILPCLIFLNIGYVLRFLREMGERCRSWCSVVAGNGKHLTGQRMRERKRMPFLQMCCVSLLQNGSYPVCICWAMVLTVTGFQRPYGYLDRTGEFLLEKICIQKVPLMGLISDRIQLHGTIGMIVIIRPAQMWDCSCL